MQRKLLFIVVLGPRFDIDKEGLDKEQWIFVQALKKLTGTISYKLYQLHHGRISR